MLVSHIGDVEAAGKAEGGAATCYAWCHTTPPPKNIKTSSEDKSGETRQLSVLWKISGKQSAEGTDKYSMAPLESGRFNILSQGVTEDLCMGKDFG